MTHKSNKANKGKAKYFLIIGIFALVLAIIAAICSLSNYYPTQSMAIDALTDASISEYYENTGIKVIKEEKQLMIIPPNATIGIIMYPGAKVSNEAYYPLFKELAEAGYLCVLLRINAVEEFFNIEAAQSILDDYPEIKDWYLAGHSLGGVIASMNLEKHMEDYKGIIFLASFSARNLTNEDNELRVLSIYGSEDKVLSLEKYQSAMDEKAGIYEEYIIEGGCHAGFAAYGPQKGDGIPTISNIEQMQETADIIEKFLKNDDF